ncbi:MAG: DUF1800 domain-containing protein [Armatimonadetes bacterium]|nr:DUF1800 domain-containing protein [Armatimonadota bacterium]MBX3109576.1 DUF1800 domain-containing protein [Fimbriimonadaceae bacterium]
MLMESTGSPTATAERESPLATTPTLQSRRTILAGGLTAALAAATGMASAQQMLGKGRTGANLPGAKPPGGNGFGNSGNRFGSSGGAGVTNVGRFWTDVNKRLLRRVTYGPTQADLTELTTLGYDAYLEKQLNWESIDDSVCESWVSANCPRLQLSLLQLNQYQGPNSWPTMYQLKNALAYRAIFSKRQLLQRMSEFWGDHFYLNEKPYYGGVMDYYRGQRNLAMTTFYDQLVWSANHGAMMDYLDNRGSVAGSINVNYAREILELHTVTPASGYTEADIYEVANILTGWGTPSREGDPLHTGIFEYTDSAHAPGTRTVMGHSFPQSGKAQGDAFLTWLATHPYTVYNICSKLCRFFLGRDPDAGLLQSLGNAWGPKGDIKALLRIILSSNQMQKSVPKFKRPFHLVVGSIRQLGLYVNEPSGILNQIAEMSHEPYKWEQPDAYPDSFVHWSTSMVQRLNFGLGISNGQVWSVEWFDPAVFQNMSDPQRMDWINQKLFLGELPVSDQIWFRRYMKGSNSTERGRNALAMALASPAHQWF